MTRPMTEELEKLEPCPFCGAQPEMESWHGGGPNKQMIKCWAADCEAGPAVTGETPDEARAHWNRRSTSSAERGMREALELVRISNGWRYMADETKAIVIAALSGIEPGEDEQARGQGRSAPISTDTKGTSNA